jgi:hypothetical protein
MKNVTNAIRFWRKTVILIAIAGFTFAACEDLFDKEETSSESADEGSGGVTSDPIVIPALTPVATDFDIGNLTQTVGYVTPVTITPKEGKSTGRITILYEEWRNSSYTFSSFPPGRIGSYPVTFNVAAADGWNEAYGLSGGTLTISAPQTPVATDFDIGNLTQTVGSVTPVTVTPKTGKSGGTVTVFYNGSTTLPSATGTYPVTFNVAATTGWNAANGLVGGTLTIRSLSEIIIDLNMDEWGLTEQTVQAAVNADRVFTVTGTYTSYRWYLDGTLVGTSSSYTFNKPAGVYQLIVVVTNNTGESRSVRFWITVNPSLAAGVWANGDITNADGEDWYLLSVNSGTTYYIWWNDRKQGNGTKNGDIAVSVRYVGSSGWILGGTNTTVDSGWTTAQSFTANQTGMVYIRVIPYNRSSSNTGAYGIVYGNSTTRPGL